MANVLHGQWGYYYPYSDETGKHGLKILDWVYSKYYQPGYLTDELIEEMLADKIITFEVPGKGDIRAQLVPYVNKKGISTKIIKFLDSDSTKIDDSRAIAANSEKIATSYWDASTSRFNYKLPQMEIDSLELDKRWKTYARYDYISDDQMYGTIKIYRPKARKDDSIILYCLVNTSTGECKESSEEEIKTLKAKIRAEYDEITRLNKEARAPLTTFVNDIVNAIWGGSSLTIKDFVINAEPIVGSVDVPNLEELVKGLMTSKNIPYLNTYFDNARRSISCIDRNSSEEEKNEIKNKLLKQLKIRHEYEKSKNVRRELYQRIEDEGLQSVVEDIDIDTALDLGYFKEVKKILVKYKTNVEKAICFYMYPEIIDRVELETRLLNLLKVYYDFYDMPEKDRKSIAKFIAKHKLSDYYDRISRYDDILEVLIDNSRDPKLLKPILNDIAGTSRASCLKDKTYYFEKRGRLRRDVILYKPIELVEELRKHIKEFNVSSDVAVLTNIELDADASFIFQFYTFANTEGDTSGFDGRRMLNLTRIYNRYHKDKIGFTFDNNDDDSEDDE